MIQQDVPASGSEEEFPAAHYEQQKTRLIEAGLSCPMKDLIMVAGEGNQRYLRLVDSKIPRLAA